MVITEMRAEIAKGISWSNEFSWVLRFTNNPSDPFVVSENPVIVDGNAKDLAEAWRLPEALIFFPLCWQACLIGRRTPFERETSSFEGSDLQRLRQIYLQLSKIFLVSPTQLAF